VAHVITRLIVGGAQENTLATMIGHARTGAFDAELLVGPTYGPEGSLVGEARRAGIVMRRVPALLREINPPADAVALFHLATILFRGRFDIVHTHSSKAGILGRVAARIARVPIVIHTAHGWAFSDERATFRRGFVHAERWCAALTDAFIAVSAEDVLSASRLGIGRPEQYTIIRSGIDLARFSRPARDPADVRRELGIPDAARVMGSVMRLSPQKNPLALVETLSSLCEEFPDLVLVIVGDGPLRAEVQSLAATRGLAGRVILPGLRSDVPDLLGLFEIFVFSSWFEGLPRVVPQAMAAGLAVVSTDSGGVREAVSEGITGYVVARGDGAALTSRVRELLRDPERARAMGARGREHAVEFDVARMVMSIEDVYRGLLASRSARGVESA